MNLRVRDQRYTRKSASKENTRDALCSSAARMRQASASEIGRSAYLRSRGRSRRIDAAHQKARFGEHGLTTAERRSRFGERPNGTIVVSVAGGRQGDDRPGVEQYAGVAH